MKVERTKEANLLGTCSTLGARKLVVQKLFGDVEVVISMGVPPEKNECKVVLHGVDVELVDDELIEGLKAGGVKVVEVKRLRARGMLVETVVVTFRGQQVPEAVTFGYMRFKVKVYVLRPIRCWRCQRFGHVEARCQAAVHCPTCGGECKIMEAYGGQCTEEVLFCNCGGRHSAAYKGCTRYTESRRLSRSRWKKENKFLC